MDYAEADVLVRQLVTGFDTLQEEYQKLFEQHHALERKLATAREQYNELSKLCGSSTISTPPLSLASSPARRKLDASVRPTVPDLLDQNSGVDSREAASKIRTASKVTAALLQGLKRPTRVDTSDVRIWSGPSAEQARASDIQLHSISESPLEHDFTVEGKPSKLGCPFASMANKNLSSHAASVLSRYNRSSAGGSPSAGMVAGSESIRSVTRVNGRESFAKRSDRRASFADPIKAEICDLSDHQQDGEDQESPLSERAMKQQLAQADNAVDIGVCPIRFLNQHSPEEVATYFQRHKHELPRSHETCVKRYQSNEKQIQELDAKYGSLVSMIQGLGVKHQGLLPEQPEDDEATGNAEDSLSKAKVQQWASGVSARAVQDGIDHEDEDRQSHFQRPLREIRVGESPSRPWGINVPTRYLEKDKSSVHAQPAQLEPPSSNTHTTAANRTAQDKTETSRCPMHFQPLKEPATTAESVPYQPENAGSTCTKPNRKEEHIQHKSPAAAKADERPARMIFNGPVFFGYNVDDALRLMREGGVGGVT